MSQAGKAGGVSFPEDKSGRRRSTLAGQQVFAAAVADLDPQAAADILADKKWRHTYLQPIYDQVTLAIQTAENALQIAHCGLDALYAQFEFVRAGESMPIPAAMQAYGRHNFHTYTIKGGSDKPPGRLEIPYHGKILSGQKLMAQLGEWEVNGIIEPSHASAIRRVHANPAWLDMSDQTIVLLGAGAEMGPLIPLSHWRANIVAVDVDIGETWRRLIEIARGSNGTFHMPVRVEPDDAADSDLALQAGCNLITETPEIGAWLAEFEGPLTIGNYAYMDGAQHVQVSLAMDAIVTQLTAARDDISVAYLLTPTDTYAIPEAAAQAAEEQYQEWKVARAWSSPKLWQVPLRVLSGKRFFTPNIREMIPAAGGKKYGISDCLVVQQGPNYALAKRLQQWRAVTARAAGVPVSANVAPATTTHSVVKNKALAAAYAGADRFQIEIFQPETSNALMAALLVHDLRYPGSAANPAVALANPLELFMEGANHNGLWRTGFAARSVLEIAALLGWRHVNELQHYEYE